MEQNCGPRCDICGLLRRVAKYHGAFEVIAHSPAMRRALTRAARFAASDAPVALVGETGTGKEVVARTIHASSPRADAPFVPVNVAALPAELLESELFGHRRGAFTGATADRRGLFEAARGGVLFLDEVGEMPLALQAKLLRVLQDGEVRRVGEDVTSAIDVRVISATHRDLARLVEDGRFREDLYYRLKVLGLRVPPLRDRPEDVLPLARQRLAEDGPHLEGFTPAAEARLLAYRWPGNVRELQNAVRHGAALATGPRVDTRDLPEELVAWSPLRTVDPEDATPPSLEDVEQAHILRVLEYTGGHQTEAARILGIARNTLWRKLRSLADPSGGLVGPDRPARREPSGA